jgi:hypothetical protein
MPSIFKLDQLQNGKRLVQLLAGFLLLVASAPTVFAQEWDQINGRDKIHDPTGVWLVNSSLLGPDGKPLFIIIDFHRGGTFTSDIQGESAFDPSAVPLPPSDPNYGNNVITSPQSGVWQKTGWNTFATTLLTMEYHVSTNPGPGSPILQFTKTQYTGKIIDFGNGITFDALITHFDPSGTIKDRKKFDGNGLRIPLEILPNSSNSLPIPTAPN